MSAVVSMADDGGTTGVLRDELGVLPPTDVRKCIVALSDAEPTLRKLFAYRFANKSLKGHTVGNLILTALEKINGSFSTAVKEAADIFHIRGEVLPVTESAKVRLLITLKNGETLHGESVLDANPKVRKYGVEKVSLEQKVKLSHEAKEAIVRANYIIIGPGDLYGSIIPNFLVDGIKRALKASRAKIIYVANLSNKKGQSDGFSVCDYIKEIKKYSEIELDIVLCNSEKPDKRLLRKYESQEGEGVLVSCNNHCAGKSKIIKANLLSNKLAEVQKGDELAHLRSFLRHDPEKLAKAIKLIIDGF